MPFQPLDFQKAVIDGVLARLRQQAAIYRQTAHSPAQAERARLLDAGIVLVAEAHAPELGATVSVRDVLHHKDHMLVPQMTAQEAIAAYDRFEAEALAVVDSAERRQVIGLLTEAHALRRYSDASERQRRELLGEL